MDRGQEGKGESRSGCWLDRHRDMQLTHLGTPRLASFVLTPPHGERYGCLGGRRLGPQVSCPASLNHVAQVWLVGLGARVLGLIPIRALQIVSLGPPVPSWALLSPYINHVQPPTKEIYNWMEREGKEAMLLTKERRVGDATGLERRGFLLGPCHVKVQHLLLLPACKHTRSGILTPRLTPAPTLSSSPPG